MFSFFMCIRATLIVIVEGERNRPVTGRMAYVKSHLCPQHFLNQTAVRFSDSAEQQAIFEKGL